MINLHAASMIPLPRSVDYYDTVVAATVVAAAGLVLLSPFVTGAVVTAVAVTVSHSYWNQY